MKRSVVTVFGLVAFFLAAATMAAAAGPADHFSAPAQSAAKGPGPGKTILWFDAMYGVDGPFLEEEGNPICGIPGDELPWEIEGPVQGRLTTDGRINIHIKGLVFTDDDIVPPGLQGINDETHFRALVCCMSETEEDTIEIRTVVTAPFPANSKGDSRINTKVDLPESCIAPIVMILAGSEDKWFAVTGFEAEEEDSD
jgi:hypothetical protein